MFIKNQQHLKKAKIICLTWSFLINVSFQARAEDTKEWDEIKKHIGIKNISSSFTGRTTKIGIIDGYFDPRSDSRSSLTKSAEHAFSGQNPRLVAFRAQEEDLGGNHANHVTSIVYRISPEAKLRVIDMYNEPFVKDAADRTTRLIKAIKKAIESKVNFINISWTISPNEDYNNKISKDLKKAFYEARDAGISIIKSAGNDNEYIGSTPYTQSLASLLRKMNGSMILAGAISYNGEEILANFTPQRYGDFKFRTKYESNKAGIAHKYTVVAPGANIQAYGASKRLIKMSGTSMAAPIVTAIAGLLKEAHPDLPTKDILKAIRKSARKVSLNQKVSFSKGKYGCGVVNFEAALLEVEKISKLKLNNNKK